MGNEVPNWFVWTTTGGLVLIIVLLWLNYNATGNMAMANYAMMQGTANMNMMNSGMMRMMANSMMKNNMMTSEEFEKIDTAYESSVNMSQYMQKMMGNGVVDEGEYNGMMDDSENLRGMMGNMMR